MRIAVDTNVLIAALTKPRGSAAKIIEAWRQGRIDIVSSEATLREARLVLDTPWLARLAGAREVEGLLQELGQRSIIIRPRGITDLSLKDEGDVRLVEAAAAGDAAYLVTADREVLLQRGYGRTEFIAAVDMARLLPR